MKIIISVMILLLGFMTYAADDLASGNSEFAFKLYGKLKEAKGNVLFSPYSISTAFAMTYAGAKGNTEKEMADALCFKIPQKGLNAAFGELQKKINSYSSEKKCQLLVANSLWPDKNYKFLDEYAKTVKDNYGSETKAVDYVGETEKSRLEINGWVEEKTSKKIKDLIPQGVLNGLTRLVMVNAIYFKGTWKEQFDKKNTVDAPFHCEKESSVKMMFLKKKFRYCEDEQVQVLQMPYSQANLSMIVILPKANDGLAALEKGMDSAKFAKLCSQMSTSEVKVFMPRMKVETPVVSLKEPLLALGMKDAFGKAADFSGMDGTHMLYIQAALHKAFMEVNEEGTEAAAATAVAIGLKCAPMEEIIFRADHPFMFFIHDSATGSILFMGRILNP